MDRNDKQKMNNHSNKDSNRRMVQTTVERLINLILCIGSIRRSNQNITEKRRHMEGVGMTAGGRVRTQSRACQHSLTRGEVIQNTINCRPCLVGFIGRDVTLETVGPVQQMEEMQQRTCDKYGWILLLEIQIITEEAQEDFVEIILQKRESSIRPVKCTQTFCSSIQHNRNKRHLREHHNTGKEVLPQLIQRGTQGYITRGHCHK